MIAPAIVEHSTASALEVAFRRSGEVILGSALAVMVSSGISKFWTPPAESSYADSLSKS